MSKLSELVVVKQHGIESNKGKVRPQALAQSEAAGWAGGQPIA